MRRTANKVWAFLSERLKFEDERIEFRRIEGRRKRYYIRWGDGLRWIDRDTKEYIIPDMEKSVNGNAV
jgi:hypothetical protein